MTIKFENTHAHFVFVIHFSFVSHLTISLPLIDLNITLFDLKIPSYSQAEEKNSSELFRYKF